MGALREIWDGLFVRASLMDPSQDAHGLQRSDTESLPADYGVTLMPQLDAHEELSPLAQDAGLEMREIL